MNSPLFAGRRRAISEHSAVARDWWFWMMLVDVSFGCSFRLLHLVVDAFGCCCGEGEREKRKALLLSGLWMESKPSWRATG